MKTADIYDLIVIGGGAAGFFGAINTVEKNKKLRVLILEKTPKLLAKVKISGGGRCNVTHHSFSPASLSQHYPRGERSLKNMFYHFQAKDTIEWFQQRGVQLKTEEDGRMFPVTNNSQTIIDCFLNEAARLGIEIKTNHEVRRIEKQNDIFSVLCNEFHFYAKKVLVTAGGYNKAEAYQWLRNLDHELIKPIPSLFTFNDSKKEFKELMGISVPNAEVRIAGSDFSQKGAVLITHWGLSGPAVIKLSAWAAEYLYDLNYTFTALVNWTDLPENEIRNTMILLREQASKKQILSSPLFQIPQRLWEHLCKRADIEVKKIWADISNKSINRLVEALYNCTFSIRGKTTFKEEFVTCGGISLADIDSITMESKKIKGLYFAGEVLNIDGETGGFNFQAAWTTAYLAASHLSLV